MTLQKKYINPLIWTELFNGNQFIISVSHAAAKDERSVKRHFSGKFYLHFFSFTNSYLLYLWVDSARTYARRHNVYNIHMYINCRPLKRIKAFINYSVVKRNESFFFRHKFHLILLWSSEKFLLFYRASTHTQNEASKKIARKRNRHHHRQIKHRVWDLSVIHES